jgi:hypothetical protein
VDRYSFIVVDLHHLLLAGLPAHAKRNPGPTNHREPNLPHFAPLNAGYAARREQAAPPQARIATSVSAKSLPLNGNGALRLLASA